MGAARMDLLPSVAALSFFSFQLPASSFPLSRFALAANAGCPLVAGSFGIASRVFSCLDEPCTEIDL